MAYGLRLSGIGKNESKELFQIEPTYWTISEVRRLVTLNWVRTNETGSYSDDDADISIDEARKLHENFKPEILKKIAYNVSCLESYTNSTDEHAANLAADYSTYVLQLEGELHTIETALGADADKFSHFHLCIFEWDSGC